MNKLSSDFGTKPSALFISPEAPYPSIGGGALRTASLLEYLARDYAVDLIVFREPGAPDPAQSVPPARFCRVDVLDLPYHSKGAAARMARNLSRAWRGSPPLIDRFAGFETALESLLDGRQYDLAILEHFWCASYVRQVRPHTKRVVVDLPDVESEWHYKLAAGESFLRAAALRRFGAAARRMEERLLPQFDHILVTSAPDADRVRLLAANAPVTIYPNALREIPAPERLERLEIVFSGNLEYPPNIEAIHFFRDRIWPDLRARPGLKWKIVGKNPEAIRGLVAGDSRIELTGPVEDAIMALASSQVAVVPVLSGSGTRVKILEAWAAATPVVSTSLGAEGLSEAGEHLVVADDPREFAAAVSRLLDSPADRRRIGIAGRRLYERRYTWPAAWDCLGTVLETARHRP
jgi:glycosyltransferase involved in cell wall biosynthesis